MPQHWDTEMTARVAAEIRRLRGDRSAQWLALKTGELGHTVTRSIIADLENGRRKYITVPELVVLAESLSVSPLELLYGTDDGAVIRYLPSKWIPRLTAVQQFSGIDEATLNEYDARAAHLAEASESIRLAAQELSERIAAVTELEQEMRPRTRKRQDGR